MGNGNDALRISSQISWLQGFFGTEPSQFAPFGEWRWPVKLWKHQSNMVTDTFWKILSTNKHIFLSKWKTWRLYISSLYTNVAGRHVSGTIFYLETAVRVLGGVHELFYPPPPSEFKRTRNIPCLQVASWTYKVVKISSSFLDLDCHKNSFSTEKRHESSDLLGTLNWGPTLLSQLKTGKKTTTCQCNQLVGGNCCYFDVLFGDPRNFRWNGKSVGEMSRLVHHQH